MRRAPVGVNAGGGMPTTTPKSISEGILELCSDIVHSATPEYIPVRPPHDANIDDCFVNVAKKVESEGGSILHGWQIWEWIDVMQEAEFHAIWEPPTGERVDLTPKKNGEDRILFLPDPPRRWTGNYVDNVRRPYIMSQLFKDLDSISKRLVLAYNKGERVAEGVVLDAKVVRPMEELKRVLGELLNSKGDLDSLCPCNSGRKYKNCHRKILFPNS